MAEQNKTGIQRLVDVLKSHGVQFVFTVTGTDIYRALEEVANRGIRVVDTRNEATACYAAIGVGKITGKPGIVMVTAGPGVTNTFTACMEAKYDETRIIVFGGAPATRDRQIGALHDLNHPAIMKPVCKNAFSVENTEEMIEVVKRAFQISSSDTPGPVFVQLPKDVLEPYKFIAVPIRTHDVCDYSDTFPLNTTEEMALKLENEADTLLASNKAVDNDLTPLAARFPIATAEEINTSAKILESAKRPILVFHSRTAPQLSMLIDLQSGLKSMGIPCFLFSTAAGLLGKSHELLLQYNMDKILPQADVVILAGIPCDFRFVYGRNLPKNGKIITVGRNRKLLTLNAPKIWKPTQIVHADVDLYLKDLSLAYKKSASLQEETWIKTCKKLDAEGKKYFQEKANEKTDVHLNPVKLCFAISNAAPDNVIFVVGTGEFSRTFRTVAEPLGPVSFIINEFSNIGMAIGVAIGVKLCRPESQVCLVVGDGSIGYHITEFDTIVRHKIPILVIVGNNASYYEIARNEIKDYDTDVGSALTYAHYEEIAKTFGGKGILMDRSNDANMEEVLGKAFEANRKGSSVLVNALMGILHVWDDKL